MIVGLDSATPPSPTQAAAAKAAGIGMWAGYVSEIPQRDGLYRPWTPAEFDVVRIINPHPIAYTSGWDDPVATRNDAANRGYRLCLDVERMIRDDGPWVQAWLDASGAGLYGVHSVHAGRRAAFHVAAWYVSDPGQTYPAGWDGSGPKGWQFQNTHSEFGVGVDRGYYDDWFGGDIVTQDEFNGFMRGWLNSQNVNASWITDLGGRVLALLQDLDTVPVGETAKGEANKLKVRLNVIDAELAAIKAAQGGLPPGTTFIAQVK